MSEGLLKQMGETKERGFAWVVRGFLGLLMIMLTIIGWFTATTLTEIKTSSKETWLAIGEVNKAVATVAQTVSDHIREDMVAEATASRERADHEARLRALEARH